MKKYLFIISFIICSGCEDYHSEYVAEQEENRRLEEEIDELKAEIEDLKSEISTKDETIEELESENQVFKDWFDENGIEY